MFVKRRQFLKKKKIAMKVQAYYKMSILQKEYKKFINASHMI